MLALKSPRTNDVYPWAVNLLGGHLYMLAENKNKMGSSQPTATHFIVARALPSAVYPAGNKQQHQCAG